MMNTCSLPFDLLQADHINRKLGFSNPVRNNFLKNSFIAVVLTVQKPGLHSCSHSQKLYSNNIDDVFLFQFSFIFLELETFKQTKAGKSPSTEFLFFQKIFNHVVFFVTFSCVFWRLTLIYREQEKQLIFLK